MKVTPIPSADPLVRWHEALACHGTIVAFTWNAAVGMPVAFTLMTSEHVAPIEVFVIDAYAVSVFQGARGKTIIFGGNTPITQRRPDELIEHILEGADAHRPLVYVEGPYR